MQGSILYDREKVQSVDRSMDLNSCKNFRFNLMEYSSAKAIDKGELYPMRKNWKVLDLVHCLGLLEH